MTDMQSPSRAEVDEAPVDEWPLPFLRSERARWAVLGGVALLLGLLGTAISAAFDPITAPAPSQPQAAPSTTLAVGPSPTTSEATPTSAGAAEVTTTVAATPAALGVAPATIDFGADGTTGEFEIRNTGGAPGDWELSSSTDALAVSLGSGRLGPGEATSIQVSLDRTRLAEEGEIAHTLTVTSAGVETVIEVVAVHQDNPIIHNPRVQPAQLNMDGGPQCSGTQGTVSARIRDTSALASAVVRWSPDGSGSVETPMNPVGNDIFEAVIGPFSVAQTAPVRIVAFDEHDNAGGANISVEVAACP